MFMKLNDIYEAQYISHKRGSLHWMIDKFFLDASDDNEYWLQDKFIALIHGRELIGLRLEEDNVAVLIPSLGGRSASFTAHQRTQTSKNLLIKETV